MDAAKLCYNQKRRWGPACALLCWPVSSISSSASQLAVAQEDETEAYVHYVRKEGSVSMARTWNILASHLTLLLISFVTNIYPIRLVLPGLRFFLGISSSAKTLFRNIFSLVRTNNQSPSLQCACSMSTCNGKHLQYRLR